MPYSIRPISAAATRPLRQQILRPHQTVDELVYPGDDHHLTLHAGAFVEDQLVGIASFAPEACPGVAAQAAWRLRGMGVVPHLRRCGIGKALLATGVEHVHRYHGDMIWCHGRTGALSFYRAFGFVTHGDEFVVPQTGPHYVLIYWIPMDRQ
ncbi:MAG: N-acetyltransferase [Chloroflexus aggregans]|uniref:N-acetyltransferase n=1 Tax=Chloroflexus aggregans TaxID=152260 RepID=A0A2J6X6C2_9CHLR|nr:MAG: N-acetyltransferase [Chloroflexus aggregans]